MEIVMRAKRRTAKNLAIVVRRYEMLWFDEKRMRYVAAIYR